MESMRPSWHLITGEYPPQLGGVSEYTRQVAAGLARAGERVHVWAPPVEGAECDDAGVRVHRLRDHFGPRGIAELWRGLDATPGPRRLLVQYVPQAFGWKGANLAFVAALCARRREPLWTMFHEVLVRAEPGWSLRRRAFARATQAMAWGLLRASERTFVSAEAWARLLAELDPRAPAPRWAPIPSNLPTRADAPAVAAARRGLDADGARVLVGHFGTYGPLVRVLLDESLARILRAEPSCAVVLVGRGSERAAAEISGRDPALAGRVRGLGALAPEAAAAHLAACDVLVQPFVDGVTTRRTSLMAGLALGVATVTNDGVSVDAVWRSSGAVALAPAPSAEAVARAAEPYLRDPDARARLGARGAEVYAREFSLERTLATLLDAEVTAATRAPLAAPAAT